MHRLQVSKILKGMRKNNSFFSEKEANLVVIKHNDEDLREGGRKPGRNPKQSLFEDHPTWSDFQKGQKCLAGTS